MNSGLELHDSVVMSYSQGTGIICLVLDANIHQSAGRPGVDSGNGYTQQIVLDFDDGVIQGEVGNLPTDILHGELQVGDLLFRNMFELPFTGLGDAKLTVFLSPDYRKVTISGSAISVKLIDEPMYVEEFRR
jgi:hypothetical protein